jgi:predicted ATP-binding protein involved in virulence
MFDHTIPLNQDEHLTMIYGINGIGKTMMFKIMNFLFHKKFASLHKITFEKFIVIFHNNYKLTIEKKKKGLFFIYTKSDDNVIFQHTTQTDVKKSMRHEREIIRFFEMKLDFHRIEPTTFIDQKEDTIHEIDELIETYSDELEKAGIIDKKIPAVLSNLIDEIDLYFIQTQRLLIFSSLSSKRLSRYRRSSNDFNNMEAVQKYSDELSELIGNKHNEYRNLSEKLELTLGKRLMQKEVKTDYSYDELVTAKEEVEKRLRLLRSVGLLSEQKEEEFKLSREMDDLSKAVISVNIQDFKTKLNIFNDIYKKLYTFLDILNNKRFSYKKISISEENGFQFETSKGSKLEPKSLSSGEQHELILMYLLLFKVPENALILLDEPEISLHVIWQKEFLNDMKDIIGLRGFDVLIATHSPSIINGEWDLTVSLEGIKETQDV